MKNARSAAGVEMARLRREKKKTQAELAQSVGVSSRMIAALEAGTRRPSVSLAQRIGAELGIEWTDFFETTERK